MKRSPEKVAVNTGESDQGQRAAIARGNASESRLRNTESLYALPTAEAKARNQENLSFRVKSEHLQVQGKRPPVQSMKCISPLHFLNCTSSLL